MNAVSRFHQSSAEQSLEHERCITEKEPFEVLKSMPHDKSPENDDLTKEFFKTFWSEVKKTILSCTLHSFGK